MPCPETVMVTLMTDGSHLLVGRFPQMPTAFVAPSDATPLRHALEAAFGSPSAAGVQRRSVREARAGDRP